VRSSGWTGLEDEPENPIILADGRRLPGLPPPMPTTGANMWLAVCLILPGWFAGYHLLDWVLGDLAVVTGGLISSIGGDVVKAAVGLAMVCLLLFRLRRYLPDLD
jgi:hypothetical protein